MKQKYVTPQAVATAGATITAGTCLGWGFYSEWQKMQATHLTQSGEQTSITPSPAGR